MMARKSALPIQLGDEDSSLLDVVDSLLNRGVVLNGDLILGVANVDLIYANLSVVIAALDRLVREEALPATRRLRKTRKRRKARSKG
jgi:gas vesicle structural protein